MEEYTENDWQISKKKKTKKRNDNETAKSIFYQFYGWPLKNDVDKLLIMDE